MEFTHSFADVRTLGNGALPTGNYANVENIWKAVEPYTRSRMNDIHLPLTLLFAEFLLDAHPEADPQVTRVAAMLHDAGWARVDESKILSEGFRSDNFMTSDVRVQHEIYGCDIAREILPGCGYDDEFIKKVTDIIDGHDTRPESHSIEDSIMRDADRLWRFNPVGLGFSAEWFGKTPQQIRLKLEQDIMPEMITPTGRAMAEAELQYSIRVLCLDVL